MSKLESLTSQEIIEHFVRRARKVKAHSLVQNGAVDNYYKPSVTITMSKTTGEMKVTNNVIQDEEALESLATRLRPFMVSTENIYLPKVFKAIESCVPSEVIAEDEAMERAYASAKVWFTQRCEESMESKEEKAKPETGSKAYAVQVLDKDDSPQTNFVPDSRLAKSWLYADEVHELVKGRNVDGVQFDFLTRYTAASSYFSEFARIIVSLLDIVKALAKKKTLQLANSVWTEPVTYAEAKKDEDKTIVPGSLFIADPVASGETLLRDMRPQDLPGSKRVTMEDLQSLAGIQGRAAFTAYDREGDLLATYPASWRRFPDCFAFTINGVLQIISPIDAQPDGEESDAAMSANFIENGTQGASDLIDKLSTAVFGQFEFLYKGHALMLGLEITPPVENSPADNA